MYIVTACARPNNLQKMYESIKFDKIAKWAIIYDNRQFPFSAKWPAHEKIVELSCTGHGIAGHPQRNMFLDIAKQQGVDGYFYFLDDDNIMHPDFWSLLDHIQPGHIYTFDQERKDHLQVLKGDVVEVGKIDTSSYTIDLDLIGDVRFDSTRYDGDGLFVVSLYEKHRLKFLYIDRVMAYYNYLRWDEYAFDHTKQLKHHEYGIAVPQDRFDGARVFVNRNRLTLSIREHLPENPVIAEIGVYQGYHSDILINLLKPSYIALLDTYEADDSWTGMFTKATHFDFVKNKYDGAGNVELVRGVSWAKLEEFPDDHFDYIYIDGDHSYDGVSNDIKASLKKIKANGYIQFNDYCSWCRSGNVEYGVLDAVNDLLSRTDSKVYGLSIDRRDYHDIAVRVAK